MTRGTIIVIYFFRSGPTPHKQHYGLLLAVTFLSPPLFLSLSLTHSLHSLPLSPPPPSLYFPFVTLMWQSATLELQCCNHFFFSLCLSPPFLSHSLLSISLYPLFTLLLRILTWPSCCIRNCGTSICSIAVALWERDFSLSPFSLLSLTHSLSHFSLFSLYLWLFWCHTIFVVLKFWLP